MTGILGPSTPAWEGAAVPQRNWLALGLCLPLACRALPEGPNLADRLSAAETSRDPAAVAALLSEEANFPADPELRARLAFLALHVEGPKTAGPRLKQACDPRTPWAARACAIAEVTVEFGAAIEAQAAPTVDLELLEELPAPTVVAEANGLRLPLQLSFGADWTLIHLEAVRRLGIPVDEQHPTIVPGLGARAWPVILPPLPLGGITLPPQLALAVEWPEERALFGILATRVAFRDRVLSFDLRSGTVRVTAAVPKLSEPTTNVRLEFAEDGARIPVHFGEGTQIPLSVDPDFRSNLSSAWVKRLREAGVATLRDGQLEVEFSVGAGPAERQAFSVDAEGRDRAGLLGLDWWKGRLVIYDPATRELHFTAKAP